MAVSVVPQNCVIDLRCSTPADSTKYLHHGPQFYHEQMEYNECYFDEQITKFNYNNNTHNSNHSPDHHQLPQDYQNSIQLNGFTNRTIVNNFADSPPSDSKDEWSNEYTNEIQEQMKPTNNSGAMHAEHAARKRRMEWSSSAEALDDQVEIVIPKVRSLDGTKGRSGSRKSSGRLDWPNDIDLDLDGELSNNGYISDSLLNFPNLTVFKQESQSPTQLESRKQLRQDAAHHQQQQHQQHHQSHQQQSGSVIENTQRFQVANNNISNSNNTTDRNDSNTNSHPNNGGHDSATHHQVSGNMMDQDAPTAGGSGQGTIGNLQNFIQHNGFDGSTSGGQQQQQGAIRSSKFADDCRFQYVLAAATSIATKNNEETLTYLNQGQSYEIKLKKLGDLSSFRGKVMKSIVKICFHERRLQYMEREQMCQWASSRPGERILDVDIPLSYGLITVNQPTAAINTIEIQWDPMKEVGVYVRVNCISTEFTPKKHGGEKGVPFRIQVETYSDHSVPTTGLIDNVVKPLHAGACQIKVFKLKGADRKHKQDREKIQKRPQNEQEKFQRSCDCTILNDISCDSVGAAPRIGGDYSPEIIKRNVSPLLANTSPVHIHKYDSLINFGNNPNSPIGINNVSSTNGLCKMMDQSMLSPNQAVDMEDYTPFITKDSTPAHLAQWMTYHRLQAYAATFAHFSGADLLRMTKEDLVQICGLADGIRMFNILHVKALTPRLTIYISFDGTMYHAIYLHANSLKEFTQKLYKLPGFIDCLQTSTASGRDTSPINDAANAEAGGNSLFPSSWDQQQQQQQLQQQQQTAANNTYEAAMAAATIPKMFMFGPNGVHVLVTDEVLANVKDESLFALQMHNGKLLMKTVYKAGEM